MFSRVFSRSVLSRGFPQVLVSKRYATTLTQDQIKLVKATAPVLQEHGTKITTHFYKRMFGNNPELKNVFNLAHQATGAQPLALANSLFAYASNIDNLGALGKAVSLIANKHASLQIRPDQYPIVGENLLASVKEVLGDAVDQPTMEAWRLAYEQFAEIFINYEANLYKEAAALEGGWEGWRKFIVSKKVIESNEIISFYLTPVDNGKLPVYKPGQFISVKRFVPEIGYEQPRQYSLSSAPNPKYLRVSVKRVSASEKAPAGKVSNLLHDGVQVGTQIDVSPPFGDFFLDLNTTTPVVLISGGVGLTPMTSMLDTLVALGPRRKVIFLHAARDKKAHAMREYINKVASENSSFVTKRVWYEDPSSYNATKSEDYDEVGRISISKVKDLAILPNADYFVCGPPAFMINIENQLSENGVSTDRIHSELFGTGQQH